MQVEVKLWYISSKLLCKVCSSSLLGVCSAVKNIMTSLHSFIGILCITFSNHQKLCMSCQQICISEEISELPKGKDTRANIRQGESGLCPDSKNNSLFSP